MRVGQDTYERPQLSKCRSCGALIIWARAKSGSHMPLNAVPSDAGEWTVQQERVPGTGLQREWAAHRATGRMSETRYVAHWASCPQARSWRTR